MNVNIYLEDSLAESLTEQAKTLGESRNGLIRLAIREWLSTHQPSHWPHSVRSFTGVPGFSAFEDARSELISPKEDPFA